MTNGLVSCKSATPIMLTTKERCPAHALARAAKLRPRWGQPWVREAKMGGKRTCGRWAWGLPRATPIMI
jgi:hypothetical protein